MKTPYKDPLLSQMYGNALKAAKKVGEYFDGKDIGSEALKRSYEAETSFHKTLRNMEFTRALNFNITGSFAKDRIEQRKLIEEYNLIDKPM